MTMLERAKVSAAILHRSVASHIAMSHIAMSHFALSHVALSHLAACLTVCVTVCVTGSLTGCSGESSFLGLRVGMSASEALNTTQTANHPTKTISSTDDRRELSRTLSELEEKPFINGRKILADTVRLTDCAIDFRRSLAFDSARTLVAVGLTHKSASALVEREQTCVGQWLQHDFGAPAETLRKDSSTLSRWTLADKSQITFESKQYTDQDYFLLVYYFR